ncbi:hypothetical protein CMUS01_06878 [Colletotrichum musicola]|uniref:Uncharacterized protein n=1 Tax=Colletotrichum musicola TaxID=2175873 RepID=A0A8H6NGD5_9PEZI|nr:hypothetical protein CMUS01_06878 [Colletotrichum musicola]
MPRRRYDDSASVSSYDSGNSRSSSRSSSASSSRSGSSKKSRSSQVSHNHIKSDHWSVSFMKWTTGAPLGKHMSLRRTEVSDNDDDWAFDDNATVYSSSSYIHYAWVTPKWDDSVSMIASRPSTRASGRSRREHRPNRPTAFVPPSHPPAFAHPPPAFPHHPHPPSPPPASFMPHPVVCDDDPGYDAYDDEYDEPEQPAFYSVPQNPHPPAPAPTHPGFIDVSGGGGGSRKYEDWSE